MPDRKIMKNHKNDQLYRHCVGIILLSKTGKVFVGKRIDNPDHYWQMPQGGIDDGEDILSAAKRELYEETSITSINLLYQHPQPLYYELPHNLRANLWQGRYIGQKQIWCCFTFMGNETEINVATHAPEFSDWCWLDLAELPHVAVPFKQNLYQSIVNIFTPYVEKSIQK